MEANNITKYYKNNTQYSAKFLNFDGTALKNTAITFNIIGKLYTIKTDSNGVAILPINLNPGQYVITATNSVNGQMYSNTIAVFSTIEANDLVKYYRNESQYLSVLLDGAGNPLANAKATFNIIGKIYTITTDTNGIATLPINLNPGNYIITVINPNDGLMHSNNITVLSTVSATDIVKYYRNETQYSAVFLDSTGNPLASAEATFNIIGKIYNITTDDEGIATLPINLNPGEYIVTVTNSNDGLMYSNNVTVLTFLITSGDVVTTYGSEATFSVKVLNKTGGIDKNTLVTFNINGNLYEKLTDENGIATLTLNLNSGNYILTYEANGLKESNSYQVKNLIEITTYNWNSGANVCQNSLIKNNLPTSSLIAQIVEMAKSGTPMITIKGGEGKSVFITAGVHGNELASQIAALRLIQELETTAIDGTVYIMPFVYPKATASNVRNYNGVNLNTLAATSGSISNNIINLIISFDCDAYGDFHCTMPGGSPGANMVMGSYNPTVESAAMAIAISQITGFSKIIYNTAGSEYPGALEDVCNLKGIPAVTCEVVSPRGQIATGSIEKSLSFMKAFLKYNSLI